MALLQSTKDLLLSLWRNFVKAVDQFGVTASHVLPFGNLNGRHTSPNQCWNQLVRMKVSSRTSASSANFGAPGSRPGYRTGVRPFRSSRHSWNTPCSYSQLCQFSLVLCVISETKHLFLCTLLGESVMVYFFCSDITTYPRGMR